MIAIIFKVWKEGVEAVTIEESLMIGREIRMIGEVASEITILEEAASLETGEATLLLGIAASSAKGKEVLMVLQEEAFLEIEEEAMEVILSSTETQIRTTTMEAAPSSTEEIPTPPPTTMEAVHSSTEEATIIPPTTTMGEVLSSTEAITATVVETEAVHSSTEEATITTAIIAVEGAPYLTEETTIIAQTSTIIEVAVITEVPSSTEAVIAIMAPVTMGVDPSLIEAIIAMGMGMEVVPSSIEAITTTITTLMAIIMGAPFLGGGTIMGVEIMEEGLSLTIIGEGIMVGMKMGHSLEMEIPRMAESPITMASTTPMI